MGGKDRLHLTKRPSSVVKTTVSAYIACLGNTVSYMAYVGRSTTLRDRSPIGSTIRLVVDSPSSTRKPSSPKLR